MNSDTLIGRSPKALAISYGVLFAGVLNPAGIFLFFVSIAVGGDLLEVALLTQVMITVIALAAAAQVARDRKIRARDVYNIWIRTLLWVFALGMAILSVLAAPFWPFVLIGATTVFVLLGVPATLLGAWVFRRVVFEPLRA